MGDGDARARGADDLHLGRRRIAPGNGVHRGTGAQRIALHQVMGALGEYEVAHGVDGVVEPPKLLVDRHLIGGGKPELRVT
jgi:hypothetical protein